MDKKLLESLNNLSSALEEIAEALKDKNEATSATAKAIQGGDFSKQIQEIHVGVKQLQKDTKEILKNQQTIMNMAKKPQKESIADDIGKDKKKQSFFKEGIGVILLIAAAVLALGIAFNLVGKVNFLSVIALSIALPLLAIGFSKVHETLMKVGFDPKKDGKNFIIAITSIALGITMSSWILALVIPITFTKLLTVAFIALTFSLMSPSIYKFMMAFKQMTWTQIIKSAITFPIILPAIALGITISSWILSLVAPVSFNKMLTVILIAATFTVISFGITKLMSIFKNIPPPVMLYAVIALPIVLPAIALAIALSSYALQLVRPVSIAKMLTAIFISVVFVAIAYGLGKILNAFKGMNPLTLLLASVMIPVIFVAISMAIAASSFFFNKIKVISIGQFLTAIGIAIVFIALSVAVRIIISATEKLRWRDIIILPAIFVVLSMAIYLSSLILQKTAIIPLGTLLNIVVFGIVLAIVAIAMAATIWVMKKMGLNIVSVLLGAVMTIVVAATIMASSHILAKGNYKNFPSLDWAMGVGLSLLAFGVSMAMLGLIAVTGFGLGSVVLLAGAAMVLVVAQNIVDASLILQKGKYTGGPTKEWAKGVSLAMGAFMPVYKMLFANQLLSIFGGGVGPEDFAKAIRTVASGIVDAANYFASASVAYKNGPTREWAAGVSKALGAFAPVYAVLMRDKMMKFFSFGQGGVSVEDYRNAIIIISEGIVTAANYLSTASASYKNGPTREWANGVAKSIAAFAPVFTVLTESSGWLKKKVSSKDMKRAIIAISEGIVDAAIFFNANSAPFTGKYPSEKWGKGVGAAIGAFAPVFTVMNESSWWESDDEEIEQMVNGISSISWAIVDAARIFSRGGEDIYKVYPTKKWGRGVEGGIMAFIDVFESLSEIDTDPEDLDLVSDYAYYIAKTARILGREEQYFNAKIDPNWVRKMSSNIIQYQALANALAQGAEGRKPRRRGGLVGGLNDLIMGEEEDDDPISRIASGMVRLARAYDMLSKSINRLSRSFDRLDSNKISDFTKLTSNVVLLSVIDTGTLRRNLRTLERNEGAFDKFSNERKLFDVSNIPLLGDKSKKVGEETELQKLDKIIAYLRKLSSSTASIDEFLKNPKKIRSSNADIDKGDED